MKQKMPKAIPAFLATGIVCLSLSCPAFAWLSDQDKVTNTFTVGLVSIELTEPEFHPEENTSLLPGQTVPKDPSIRNTGNIPAFVYLRVVIPAESIRTAGEDGKPELPLTRPLFSYEASPSWNLMDSCQDGEDCISIYSYGQILQPGEETDPLFTSLTFSNLLEGELTGKEERIPIQAYAIQAEGTGEGGATVEEQALHAFAKIGGHAGYLIDRQALVNPVAPGHVTTKLTEDFPLVPPRPLEEDPSFKKEVRVTNSMEPPASEHQETGMGCACYVRARILYSDAQLGEVTELHGLDPSLWSLQADGYYYYTSRLEPGETTAPLFTAVTVSGSRLPENVILYGEDYRIRIYEEAVQAGERGTWQEAWAFYRGALQGKEGV